MGNPDERLAKDLPNKFARRALLPAGISEEAREKQET
jgi:hypothetical protein